MNDENTPFIFEIEKGSKQIVLTTARSNWCSQLLYAIVVRNCCSQLLYAIVVLILKMQRTLTYIKTEDYNFCCGGWCYLKLFVSKENKKWGNCFLITRDSQYRTEISWRKHPSNNYYGTTTKTGKSQCASTDYGLATTTSTCSATGITRMQIPAPDSATRISKTPYTYS